MIEKPSATIRTVSILTAILIHGLLLFFTVFTIKTEIYSEGGSHYYTGGGYGNSSGVMKLMDLREEIPQSRPRSSVPIIKELAAETVLETDEAVSNENYYSAGGGAGGEMTFFPMYLVSQLPKFPEDEIRKRVIYPPIAQRLELEGTVYLEIFVDREGIVRDVIILKEDPPGRGFSEAAVHAFLGFKGSPALANGKEVPVRYRYPVRFSLK